MPLRGIINFNGEKKRVGGVAAPLRVARWLRSPGNSSAPLRVARWLRSPGNSPAPLREARWLRSPGSAGCFARPFFHPPVAPSSPRSPRPPSFVGWPVRCGGWPVRCAGWVRAPQPAPPSALRHCASLRSAGELPSALRHCATLRSADELPSALRHCATLRSAATPPTLFFTLGGRWCLLL